ncbi:hypothetical protein NCCP2495_19410 [Dietzia sp. NCCP-2495]|uniref:AAA family ATPase n=1 Tax=Dietzia sp. NCCP-2495 TaxID=2934675 RepID=UPI002232861C|nr:AAA family ATPase [Dietzia sp. NCCP-2495]GLB64062.1 hypothetical protein NCCP2495_19410 [Dietzia sp. NCCP-2495]
MTVAITDEGVDIDLAMEHLDLILGEAKGYAWLASCGRAEVVNGKPKMINWQQESFAWPAERDDVREYIETHAMTRELFFCPFVHRSGDSKRKGASVERQWVVVDQDRPMTNPGALRPTLVVNSGTPGHSHLYYSVPEGVEVDKYQAFAKGLGECLGCGNDKTTDEGFLRLPGTRNLKHDPPTLCEVVERTDATYTQQGLSVAVNVRPSAHSHDRVPGAQNRSQGLQFEPVKPAVVPRSIKRALREEDPGDGTARFKRTMRLVKECQEAGMSQAEALWVLTNHEPSVAKFQHEDRLRGQVVACWEMSTRDEGPGTHEDENGLSLLDLDDLLTRGIEPVEWLVPQVFQRGGLYQVVSYAGMGKSLLMLDISQRLARGIEALPGAVIPDGDSTPSKALTVLYIDGENTQRIIMSRLQEMDVRGLNRLKYASMPPLLPLDTERGGAEFVAHVRRVQAEVVVIDTLSRFVEGDENDAATYAALYRYALAPLRADGVTIIRLDHTGKDQSKGARGSSAKNTDVDGSWIIQGEKNSSRFKLVCDKDRTGDLASVVPIRRTQEPLGHAATMLGGDVPTPSDGLLDLDFTEVDEGIRPLVEAVDDAGLDHDAGRVLVARAINKAGLKAGTEKTQRVIAYRKARGPAL